VPRNEGTVSSFLEESDAGRAEVLDVDDRVAGGAERLEDLAGLGGRGLRLVQRHVPAGKVVALNVDNDEGFAHDHTVAQFLTGSYRTG
jgi:hypothetical protein